METGGKKVRGEVGLVLIVVVGVVVVGVVVVAGVASIHILNYNLFFTNKIIFS